MAKRPKPADERAIASAGVCGLLAETPADVLNDAAIEKIVVAAYGSRVVKTLLQVAAAFDVQVTSLRSHWRSQGMPGRAGHWDLVEIVQWKRGHLSTIAAKKVDERGASDPRRARLLEIELRQAELELLRREREEAAAAGDMINRHDAVAELAALLSVSRQMLLRIPAEVQPVLPAESAVVAAGEIERGIQRALTYIADRSSRILAIEVPIFKELLAAREQLRKQQTNGFEDHDGPAHHDSQRAGEEPRRRPRRAARVSQRNVAGVAGNDDR